MSIKSEVIKDFPYSKYKILEDFTEIEKKAMKTLISVLKGQQVDIPFELDVSDFVFEQTMPDKLTFEKLQKQLLKVLPKIGLTKDINLVNKIIFDSLNLKKLGNLLLDPELEEIMINSPNSPVFVYHKQYGTCKTDITFDKKFLLEFVEKIIKQTGREFNENNPFLDARLLEGSRINATYDFITPFGISITIRKFSTNPLSIIKLIDLKTISIDLASFLWLCIDGFSVLPQNILISGGTGGGKTSLLVALTSFIPYSDRIITIEDTPEINLSDRENWISMESRVKTINTPEITMDDLLKNALRMRPDRLIVGEVRGKEAETLFTAMNTGHRGILGTLHANNTKDTIMRLKSFPMNVAENQIPELNLIINIEKFLKEDRTLDRKIIEVAEIEKMQNQVLISNIFEEDSSKNIIRTDIPSRTIENIAIASGKTKDDVAKELEIRKQILTILLKNEVFDYLDVTKFMQKFYEDKDKFLEKMNLNN